MCHENKKEGLSGKRMWYVRGTRGLGEDSGGGGCIGTRGTDLYVWKCQSEIHFLECQLKT